MMLDVVIGGRTHRLSLDRRPGGDFTCTLDGETLSGSAHMLEPGVLSLLIGGRSYRCLLSESPLGQSVQVEGMEFPFQLEDPRSLKARRARGGGVDGPCAIKAPMPGRVVRVLAEKGAAIEAQQGILVIEAMKMQNELKAPRSGRIAEMRAAPGDTVNAGQVLAIIE